MSDPSRRLKNPLLSAAGVGFPFDNLVENNFLVPVAPAAPAVLPDESEIGAFVAQEQAQGVQSISPTRINTDSETLHTTSTHQQSTGIDISPGNILNQDSASQPQRQGYFSSILSSLPNLSLSSIKGETNSPQSSGDQSGIDQSHYGRQDFPGTTVASSIFESSNPHDNQIQNPSVPLVPVESFQATPQRPPPVQPQRSGGPTSFRLGSQRRLKYAPPPDLTSNTPKYPAANLTPFPYPQGISSATTFLDPTAVTHPQSSSNSVQSYSSPVPGISENPSPAQTNSPSLRESNGASPLPPGIVSDPSTFITESQNPLQSTYQRSVSSTHPSSAPRNIQPWVPEPITPQNTPSTASFLEFAPIYPSYSSYASHPGGTSSSGSIDIGKPTESRHFTSHPESTGITFEVLNPINPQPYKINQESIVEAPTLVPVTENLGGSFHTESTFSPISAAKVSEKLEHLLAERPEEFKEIKNSLNFDTEAVVDTTKVVRLEKQKETESKTYPSADSVRKDLVLGDVVTAAGHVTDILTNQTALGQLQHEIKRDNLSPAEKIIESSAEKSNKTVHFLENSPISKATSNYFTSLGESQSTPSLYNPATFQAPSPTSYLAPATAINTSNTAISTHLTTAGPGTSQFWIHDTGHSNVLNPVYGAPIQCAPTFYDPTQFAPNQNLISKDQSTSEIGFLVGNSGGYIAPPTPPMTAAAPEPSGSATLNPVQMSASPLGRTSPDTIPFSLQKLAAGTTERRMQYRPVYLHWFHRRMVENKILWLPFSMQDSLNLEEVHNSTEITPDTTVATDGGRYDVNILRRQRKPVYWSGSPGEVRRCSWFYKGPSESRYVPYEESTAVRLEEEYKQCCLTDNWNKRVELNNGEYIIFHSATVQGHYLQASSPELAPSWGNSAGASSRPRVVKRGVSEFNIDEGEPEKVDHLLFLVHGIGSVCDLKFRSVEEVVDEFRSISLQLVQSHYRTASEHGIVNKIEVLPVSWHTTLHSEDTGIDKKLQAITLKSIPKLRHFTNDTLLDILFYTSPIYCQTIMQTVGTELNRLYGLFKERNPGFQGGVYLGGHSLGSLIIFDLLCHQKPPDEEIPEEQSDGDANVSENGSKEDNLEPIKSTPVPVLKRRLSKKISYVMGAAGTGQPYIHYPELNFHPKAFFALGSPIGMFVTVRGIDTLGEDFALPTCPAFFNIFHPFDPVAYRIEALIDPQASNYRPMLIPHHKGRKRMHLELKETMVRVGTDLKQKLLDSVRTTWNSVYQLAMFHKSDNQALEREIDKVVEEQLQNSPTETEQQANDDGGADIKIGKLNGGRRIDYVLQEAPFESINEYIFTLTSHVCYWESEDTMLMILKEIYGSMGIQADAQLPPQTMIIERSSPSQSTTSGPSTSNTTDSLAASALSSPIGMDPTAPITNNTVGPPPTSGFVYRKS
ncbi:SEC23-interacting protein isoform X2 [Cephus cinctus]|uniref:SEC23-interacting protein isoform X2 n=1 Tax=Cephus cinctus TaxID=211228 RepID=A0AAJ7BVB4_CEPCN|nr:SEC23-interacting protein isoform X2 [Cephus cinctus]